MPRLQRYKWDDWVDWAVPRVEYAQRVAIDTETSGVGFYDEAFCATLTWRGLYGQLESCYVDLESEGAERRREALRTILLSASTWVFHNAKFDLQKLVLAGVLTYEDIEAHEIHDTQAVQFLLDENERKGLKHLARLHLGEETNEEAVLKKVRRKLGLRKEDGYQYIPRDVLLPYAIKDTEFTLRLWEKLMPRLPDALEPAYRREIDLIRVLLRMEANGFAVDEAYARERKAEYGEKVMEGWQGIVDLTGNPGLNPQSPAQLKEAFEARGHVLESTAEHVLKGLDDELARQILQYRQDKKLHTTYLTALLAEQRNGLLHPWFNPVQARTGRMSSSGASNN